MVLAVAVLAAVPVSGQNGSVAPLLLRPGDSIRLEVPDVAELSGDFTISDDGAVLLPLLGPVLVVGRPFADVRREILDGYEREILGAPVRVTPVLRIAVLGEVRQPGLVPADPTLTLADVLAAAGGLTPQADADRITLLRNGTAMRFSLEDGGELLLRPLQPGDQVVVDRRSWWRENLNVLVGAAASVVAAAVTSLILR